jgi:hypothetical protein
MRLLDLTKSPRDGLFSQHLPLGLGVKRREAIEEREVDITRLEVCVSGRRRVRG